ncbi:glycosyltransferase family 2 protein [Maridesulfovibrio zosterae]|uniref:glycosyltransferase family 2 protein n=1 Tax=Maridesulfovibrio zosterae TaxID=82171 RepID=UPI0004869854|nr:glycosyltransferase family 2 protein [Maridesulfovibrio zosterae]
MNYLRLSPFGEYKQLYRTSKHPGPKFSMHKVSIITPCLNAAPFIQTALLSIAEQNYPNLEHIIVDGGSTDETLTIVERYKMESTSVLSERDNGTSQAINNGFAIALGAYAWVLNADDMLAAPDSISTLAAYLDNHPQCDFVFGHMNMLDATGRQIGVRSFSKGYGVTDLLADRRHLPFAGCLIRRKIFKDLGGFNTSYQYSNDLDFYLRLAAKHSICRLNKVTGSFRLHAASSTSSHIAMSGQETARICIDALNDDRIISQLKRDPDVIRSAIRLFQASCEFHDGEAQAVRHHLWKAAQLTPSVLIGVKPWIYGLLSLGGTQFMHMTAAQLRRLIHKKGWYSINNAG